MDKPTRTPRDERELVPAGDATPIPNPQPACWQQTLTAKILAELDRTLAMYIGQYGGVGIGPLAASIVEIVNDVVGQADEILHELSTKLDEERTRVTALWRELEERKQQVANLDEQVDRACRLVSDLERECDRIKTAAIVQRIELERARDHAQDLELKLAGALARMNAAEESERKLRGGN